MIHAVSDKTKYQLFLHTFFIPYMKPKTKLVQAADGTNYLIPFVLITSLFFL